MSTRPDINDELSQLRGRDLPDTLQNAISNHLTVFGLSKANSQAWEHEISHVYAGLTGIDSYQLTYISEAHTFFIQPFLQNLLPEMGVFWQNIRNPNYTVDHFMQDFGQALMEGHPGHPNGLAFWQQRHAHAKTCDMLLEVGLHANIIPRDEFENAMAVAAKGNIGSKEALLGQYQDALVERGLIAEPIHWEMPLQTLENIQNHYYNLLEANVPEDQRYLQHTRLDAEGWMPTPEQQEQFMYRTFVLLRATAEIAGPDTDIYVNTLRNLTVTELLQTAAAIDLEMGGTDWLVPLTQDMLPPDQAVPNGLYVANARLMESLEAVGAER